jgi:hypothetical protein
MRSTLMLAAVAAALFSTTGSAHAQNGVPGGWSNQVNYQGVGQGFGTIGQPFGYSGGVYGGSYSGYGNGGYNRGVANGSFGGNSAYIVRSQTTNNLGFLGATIQRTTRVRRTR